MKLTFYEQGTIVDRIDYNIQNVVTSVEEGFKQLQKVTLFLSLCACTFSFVLSSFFLSFFLLLWLGDGRRMEMLTPVCTLYLCANVDENDGC